MTPPNIPTTAKSGILYKLTQILSDLYHKSIFHIANEGNYG